LSQKSATVAEFGDCRRCLGVFCDSRTFLRQCGQGLGFSEESLPKKSKISRVIWDEFLLQNYRNNFGFVIAGKRYG